MLGCKNIACWLALSINFLPLVLSQANSYQYRPPVYQYEPYIPVARTTKTPDPPTTTTVQTLPETTTTIIQTTPDTTTSTTTTSTTTTSKTTTAQTMQQPTTQIATELNYKIFTSAIPPPSTAGPPPDHGYFSGYIPLGGYSGQNAGYSGRGKAPNGGQQQALPPPPPYQAARRPTPEPSYEKTKVQEYAANPTYDYPTRKVEIDVTTPFVPAPAVYIGEQSGTTQSQTANEHYGGQSLAKTTGFHGLIDAPSPPAPHVSDTATPDTGADPSESTMEPTQAAKRPESAAQPGYVFPSMINYGSINGPPPPKFVLEKRGSKAKPQKARVGYGYGYPPSPRTTAPMTTFEIPDTTTTAISTTIATTEPATTTTTAPPTTTAPSTTLTPTTEPLATTQISSKVTPCTGDKGTTTRGYIYLTTVVAEASTIAAVTPCNDSQTTNIPSTEQPTNPPLPATTSTEVTTNGPVLTTPCPSSLTSPTEATTEGPTLPTPCPSSLTSTVPALTTTEVATTAVPQEATTSAKPPCTKDQRPPVVDDPLPAYGAGPIQGKSPNVANCNDGFDKCVEWAEDGECEANPFWMKPNCQKSCKSCGINLVDIDKPNSKTESCLNHHELCQFWKKVGECERNEPYMSRHCPLSCGFC